MANVKVLAKDAEQVAVGEKDGAGASAAHQRVLFAEVGAEGRHLRLVAGAA
jgi:hypothetical protein